MRRLKLRPICFNCSSEGDIIEVETYPEQKHDNLSPIFRWLFQNKWGGEGTLIICPYCQEKQRDEE